MGLRLTVLMSLGEKQASGSHEPYVCKYIRETSLGKELKWKMMSTVAIEVMVEVKKKKR